MSSSDGIRHGARLMSSLSVLVTFKIKYFITNQVPCLSVGIALTGHSEFNNRRAREEAEAGCDHLPIASAGFTVKTNSKQAVAMEFHLARVIQEINS
jgi:hypothetical protein